MISQSGLPSRAEILSALQGQVVPEQNPEVLFIHQVSLNHVETSEVVMFLEDRGDEVGDSTITGTENQSPFLLAFWNSEQSGEADWQ